LQRQVSNLPYYKGILVEKRLTKDGIIDALGPYFEQRDDILMAFLFGSWAAERFCDESDVDIAVYFKPQSGRMEWEATESRYDGEGVVWLEVERLLGGEVDLLVLNRAPSSIAESAISGAPIVIKDRGLYLDFMLRVTSEAIDFREFISGYWMLKEEMRADAA